MIASGGRDHHSSTALVARRLRDDASLRIVRRRTSAKRSDAHQPEMPSIAGPSSRMVDVSKRGRTMFSKAPDAFFTAVNRNGGRPRRPRQPGHRWEEDGDRPSIE
jgi:hypothetical protein